MKIVYYTDQLYLHGGIEKVLSQKLNYLATTPNYEVYLITTEQKGKKYCYYISDKVKCIDLGINYIRSKSYFNPKNLSRVPKHIYRLKKRLKEINPDVLIVCNYGFDFYFIPFISGGIKTVKEFHSSRFYYIKKLHESGWGSKFMFNLNNWIETRYNRVAVLNNDEKKYYKSKNIVVIPNPVPEDKSNVLKEREKVIIAAGRIAPVKQFDHLIKSWALISNEYPDWEMHIYGEGSDLIMNDLNWLIVDLKVKNIYLKGATNELSCKMKKASLFAMTSLTECFPMVLLEALVSGLPIVSYDCPHGPSNIVTNNKDGVLVKHNSIRDFSMELSKLIENKKIREIMSKNALENANKFKERKVMKQWLNLFENLSK